ncbi:MAG: metal-dependent hydrolase [Deltaproteobacteria bacterium]|nr:metal-dependent hydrolase [Deltaproteobacteria bacterium]
MDPLAHTLIGATLGETRFNRWTPLARTTLIIAANIPDIDAGCGVLGRDFSLGFRRGHTHGVLAMIVLPIVLTAIITLVDRKFRRPRGKPPVDPRAILALSVLGVLTHPFLDWLNNYGVRLLMPFSDEWFYGDAVFIIDPWIWLTAGAAVFLAHSHSRRSLAGWGILALLASALVLGTSWPPLAAKVAWVAGLGILIALRVRLGARVEVYRLATGTVLGIAVYAGAMVAGSALARAQARTWYAKQGVEVEAVMAAPLPARPLARDVVARAGDRYLFAELDWLADPILRRSHPDVAVGDGPIARQALALRPGLETWIRFPAFEVERSEGGHEVRIRDVRYDRHGARLGRAVVLVPETRP